MKGSVIVMNGQRTATILFICISFCIAVSLFFACSSPSAPEVDYSQRTIVFHDSGRISRHDLYKTAVRISVFENDSLKLDSLDELRVYRRGMYEISSFETDSLWQIIEKHDLWGAADPVLPPEGGYTLGFAGTLIIFKTESDSDTILISRSVQYPTFWSQGLRELIAYKDTLLNRYRYKD